jgi:hypothetical protein
MWGTGTCGARPHENEDHDDEIENHDSEVKSYRLEVEDHDRGDEFQATVVTHPSGRILSFRRLIWGAREMLLESESGKEETHRCFGREGVEIEGINCSVFHNAVFCGRDRQLHDGDRLDGNGQNAGGGVVNQLHAD